MRKKTLTLTALIAAGAIAGLGFGIAPALAADAPGGTASDTARHGGHHGPGGNHGGRGFDREVVMETLGLTDAELRAARDAGTTLAELAEQQDVPVQTLIDALVEAAEERIAQAVEDDRLTQEQADEKLADLGERITNKVNGLRPDGTERPARPEGGERGHGDRNGGESDRGESSNNS